MNRILIVSLILGLGCLCQSARAQQVTLIGRVSDSINNPLELSNVIAINPNTNAIASYGISDAEGRYKLHLKKDSLYLLRASYLGYQSWEKSIRAEKDLSQNIVLKPSPDQLDEVELIQELPVSISGDTITYKTDAFTSGKERKLEQVLEQLPGFEVDDEGQIKVQGKDVSKLLVEGKEFFDGDTKMATKNIPANAVDKVQVLRDYNEIGPLSGVSDSDDIALNIKLKEGKKNLWFGDISGGLGPDDRYLAHPNVFYYSPKTSVNFIGDLNNIGEQSFTLQDYFRFNGGLASLGQRSGSSINLSGDDIGLSLIQNNRAENIISRLAALNFSYKPNNKINFGGFGILSATDTDISSRSDRTYIREDGNNEERLISNTLQENTSMLLKLSATFTPNSKWYVNYDGFVKGSRITDDNRSNSDFGTVSNDIVSISSRDPFSVEQTFSAYYAKDDDNVFSLESNYLYKEQRPEYNLLSTAAPFIGSIPLQGTSPFGLFQEETVQTNKLDLEFNYYRVLNKTNHISFTMGTAVNGQRLRSGLEEYFQDGSSLPYLDNSFNNLSNFNFLDTYFGLGYRIKLGKLTLSPGISFHIYDTENQQRDEVFELDKTLLLPRLRAKYQFNSSQSLQFNYALQAEFADIQSFSPALQLMGYNSLFEGNTNLRNAWYHSFALNYFNFSMFNFTNINAGLNYQKRYDAVGNAISFQGLDVLSTPINISLPNETFSGYGQYERKFPLWKASLRATLAYGKNNNQIDGLADFNRSFTQNYRLSLETRFKEAPNVEIGYEKIWNDYSSNSIANNFVTNRPFANIEAYFLKNFSFTADYQYNNYKNRDGGTRSNYDFLNAALYYQKEDSPWEFILSGLNLLNTTSIRQDSFSDNLIGTYEYFVQPRYFMFTIKYDL
ncbi:carboxypeptidase regulatory-like domain-containing protein [Muriicola sp. Z0-33]|uniref:carboxypeptidase regulatory-like domain-containing protein n=1 Tax=Muriicola sp. Z0-33 TaxID=2816957 RepID=UPI002237D084|nr:carboxypeptidase-like regulatory domain-containing protein [Muriicola sp. Z0-33]MCW5516109.1 TonB-dependent receptor [Muriicola sp. Z0-33]